MMMMMIDEQEEICCWKSAGVHSFLITSAAISYRVSNRV